MSFDNKLVFIEVPIADLIDLKWFCAAMKGDDINVINMRNVQTIGETLNTGHPHEWFLNARENVSNQTQKGKHFAVGTAKQLASIESRYLANRPDILSNCDVIIDAWIRVTPDSDEISDQYERYCTRHPEDTRMNRERFESEWTKPYMLRSGAAELSIKGTLVEVARHSNFQL